MSANQNLITFQHSGGKANVTPALDLGGEPSEGLAIQSNTLHNIFDHVTKPRADAGEYQYLCFYIKVVEATNETVFSPIFWLDRDTLNDENEFKWGIEANYDDPVYSTNGYRYRQWKSFDGVSTFVSIADAAPLDLNQHSISCWFNTSKADYSARGMLVNKGGDGSDTAGQNLNYGIWINTSEHLQGGFEEGSGTDHFTGTTDGPNVCDGKWHHSVITYDGITIRLYLDGVEISTHVTSTTPEVNAQPVVIGKNSRDDSRYFEGGIDEVRIWNNDLTSGEVTALFEDGTIPQISAMVYVNKFEPYYIYSPFRRYNGTSDFDSIAHTASLNCTQYTVSIWFRTSKNYSGGVGYLFAKGNFATETAGQNFNYSMLITTGNLLEVFHETSAGTNIFVDSSITVNDGKWHHALATFDQVNLTLYLDGVKTGTPFASATAPDNNTKPLIIGAHEGPATFFQGELDELLIWNNDLTYQEIQNYIDNNYDDLPQIGNLVYYNGFGDFDLSLPAQTIAANTMKPIGVTFTGSESMPNSPNMPDPEIRDWKKSAWQRIWLERRILAGSKDSMDNDGLFKLSILLTRLNDGSGDDGGTAPPPDVTNTTLAFVGDSDCTSITDDVFDLVKAIPNLGMFLIGGDLYYGSGAPDCVLTRLGTIKTKTKPCMGNHDDEVTFYKNNFSLGSNTYHAFTVENIRCIAMDSEISFSVGSNQHDFVIEELQNAKNDNNIDWIIVYIHRPFYTADTGHAGGEGSKADIYFPEFDTYGVDVVLQAHNHVYQRSRQVVYGDNDDPDVVNSSLTTYVKGVGRIVISNGTGGHDDPQAQDDEYGLGSAPSWQAFQSADHNGIVKLTFTGTNNSTLTITYVDTNSDIIDTCTIS